MGGTFERIHAGHERLLAAAGAHGPFIVGLSTDAFARERGKRAAEYAARRQGLERALERMGLRRRARIVPLADPFGPALEAGPARVLVVSEETAGGAEEVNRRRVGRGLRPLRVVAVPLARGAEGIRISSSRIAAGLVGPDGRRRRPLLVAVGSDNPTKLEGARRALARALPGMKVRVRGGRVRSGVGEQPVGFARTWAGALRRARQALRRTPGAEYGLGLESGLIPFGGRHFDIQFCALYDGQEATAGCSMGFPLPAEAERRIFRAPIGPARGGAGAGGGGNRAGPHRAPVEGAERRPVASMGQVISRMAGIADIGRKGGAIEFLSQGLLHRREMVEQAALTAFVQRRNPPLEGGRRKG